MSIEKVEHNLLRTRKTLAEVCRELNVDIPARDELTCSPCTQCSTWHYTYKVVEDLDGNHICQYCESIFGL